MEGEIDKLASALHGLLPEKIKLPEERAKK